MNGFNLIQSRVLAFFPKSIYARLPDSLIVLLTLQLPEDRGREARLRDFRGALREVLESALHDARERCGMRFFASAGGPMVYMLSDTNHIDTAHPIKYLVLF